MSTRTPLQAAIDWSAKCHEACDSGHFILACQAAHACCEAARLAANQAKADPSYIEPARAAAFQAESAIKKCSEFTQDLFGQVQRELRSALDGAA